MTSPDTLSAAAPATLALKTRTADLHQRAELGPFMGALVRGQLPQSSYIAMLEQMLHVHTALEVALRAARDKVPAIGKVVKDQQFREPHIRADLAFFEVASPAPANAATRELISSIERVATTNPLGLLGMHYVLEGSNNGNRFISRPIAKAYGLTPPQGLGFLLPHGDDQPRVWSVFKADLDACELNPAQVTLLVESARAMYQGIMGIHDAIAPRE